ncbi:hypothetical protein GCM10015536_56760 [Streptomyces griseomycini]|nr:hypothetical protein GCM10015536_56760 [Streptomyces griseomycini]
MTIGEVWLWTGLGAGVACLWRCVEVVVRSRVWIVEERVRRETLRVLSERVQDAEVRSRRGQDEEIVVVPVRQAVSCEDNCDRQLEQQDETGA